MNMGKVTHRRQPAKGGPWYVFARYGNQGRALKVGNSSAKAQRVAERIQEQFDSGDTSFIEEVRTPTFKRLALEMLRVKDPKAPGADSMKVKASTLERYEGVLRLRVLPELGKMPINEIGNTDVGSIMMRAVDDGVSGSTMTILRSLLIDTFARAFLAGHVKVNVAREFLSQAGLPKTKRNKLAGKPFTKSEMPIFLNAANTITPDSYVLFSTLMMTGMRLGECLALTVDDLDFGRRLINVNKSYRRELSTPKSETSIRKIPMSAELALLLRSRAAGKPGEGLLFGRKGGYENQNQVRRKFKRVFTVLNKNRMVLESRRLHDLRHTFGSINAAAGGDLHKLKQWMGHSSIQITSDRYGLPQETADRSEIDAFGELAFGISQQADLKTVNS